MRSLFLLLLAVFVFSSYADDKSINKTSDIRVEIKSQIKVLLEKKDALLKRLSEASVEEKREIKKMIKQVDEKIERLKNLIRKYTSFTGYTG
jgi:cell division protein FtsB